MELQNFTPGKVLIYSSTGELWNGFKSALSGNAENIIVVNDIAQAKEHIASGKYMFLITDLTIYDPDARDLMHWANSKSPQLNTLFAGQSKHPRVDTEVWKMYDDHIFHHEGQGVDNLTVPLSMILHPRSSLQWARNVVSEIHRTQSQQSKGEVRTVLLIGATGTAKFSIAQIAHFQSDRRCMPFVFVNCKNPNPSDNRTWTQAKRGDFIRNVNNIMASAHKGTLYFHNIDCLEMDAQLELANILRSLDSEKQLIPGIIICSTRNNLEEQVKNGKCSSNLFSAINNIVMRVPSLSDYKDEIDELATELLRKYCVSVNKPERILSRSACDSIKNFIWGHNVRELFGVLKHADAMTDEGKPLTEADLRLAYKIESDDDSNREALVRKALRKAGGVVSNAAAELGISRKTLYSWLKIFKINPKIYK